MGLVREFHPLGAREASLKRERFIPLRGSSRESFIPKSRAFRDETLAPILSSLLILNWTDTLPVDPYIS